MFIIVALLITFSIFYVGLWIRRSNQRTRSGSHPRRQRLPRPPAATAAPATKAATSAATAAPAVAPVTVRYWHTHSDAETANWPK